MQQAIPNSRSSYNTSMPDSALWKRITTALSEAGLSTKQVDIAKLCGVKPPSVYEWRRGKSTPSKKNLYTIAVAASVSVEWLETGRGPKHPEPPRGSNLEAILAVLNGMDDSELTGVLDYVRYLKNRAESDAEVSQ